MLLRGFVRGDACSRGLINGRLTREAEVAELKEAVRWLEARARQSGCIRDVSQSQSATSAGTYVWDA